MGGFWTAQRRGIFDDSDKSMTRGLLCAACFEFHAGSGEPGLGITTVGVVNSISQGADEKKPKPKFSKYCQDLTATLQTSNLFREDNVLSEDSDAVRFSVLLFPVSKGQKSVNSEPRGLGHEAPSAHSVLPRLSRLSPPSNAGFVFDATKGNMCIE